MDALLTFFVTAFVSLFVTLDAVGNVPIFLSITPHNSEAERAAMVSRAALVVFAVLVLFAAFGNLIFKFFGVTIEAFRIVAGLRLLKETGMRIFTRVMGLILAAIAVQFVLTGIKEAFHLSA